MAQKPTYEELEQIVLGLEKKLSDLKLTEEALRESEEKHRSILENIEEGYFEADIVGNSTFFNDSAAKILGYSRDELMGMNNRQYTDEENAKKLYQTFNKVYTTGKTHKGFDWEVIRKDGSKRYIEASVSLRKDSKGQPIGFRSIVRDVSKRKRTEKKLRESEELYRSLFKNNHSIMLLIDSENADIVDANSAAISYYGWSHEEITGKKITDINILTKEKVFQEMERAKKGQRQHFYFRHRLSSGEIRDVEVYSGPITVYGRKLLYSIIHDITERKHTEEALQESEERFRTLFEKVPAPIHGYGPDGTIHYWNKASENTYGYKKDEAIGNNIVELIIPPEMRAFVRDAIKQGAETGEMPPPEELLLTRQDGSRAPIFSSHTVLKLDGKEPELYSFDVDMTVQKKLQERLQQAQKMESISTMSGGIAHQFNNALSGITGNIDLLEMDFPDNETIANYTRAMKDSARRMMQLTAQLLAYARGGKFHAKTVLFSDFVRETLPLVKHTLGSAIDVDTDRLLGILNVKADLTQMQMVLSAVLTNASEAIEGKGRIQVVCRDTIITDETVGDFPGLTPGNYANLTIIDDGKGMDKETRTLIFEPFFTTKFTGQG